MQRHVIFEQRYVRRPEARVALRTVLYVRTYWYDVNYGYDVVRTRFADDVIGAYEVLHKPCATYRQVRYYVPYVRTVPVRYRYSSIGDTNVNL